MTVLWEWGFEGAPVLLCPLPVAARLLVYTMIVDCWFSRLPHCWGTGSRNGQVKMPQDSLFLLKFHCFSCINISWVTLSLWLISRVLKRLPEAVFAHVLFAFMEERIFGCVLHHFHWCHLKTVNNGALASQLKFCFFQLYKSLWISSYPLLKKSGNRALKIRKTFNQSVRIFMHIYFSNKFWTSAMVKTLLTGDRAVQKVETLVSPVILGLGWCAKRQIVKSNMWHV